MLVIGERRFEKLRKYFGEKGIKLPSKGVIREQEKEMSLKPHFTEAKG